MPAEASVPGYSFASFTKDLKSTSFFVLPFLKWARNSMFPAGPRTGENVKATAFKSIDSAKSFM